MCVCLYRTHRHGNLTYICIYIYIYINIYTHMYIGSHIYIYINKQKGDKVK